MKTVYAYLSVLIFFSCSLVEKIRERDKDDYIYWSENVKLTWNDFKCKDELKSKHGASSQIETKIRLDLSDKNVDVIFVRNLSCKKKDAEYDLGLLKHEQYHFNIAELFARKYRKIILEHPDTNDTEVFYKIHKDERQYQDLYDSETNHSLNREKQKQWEIKIDQELQKLQKYSSDSLRGVIP